MVAGPLFALLLPVVFTIAGVSAALRLFAWLAR